MDVVERVARKLCELQIRQARRWDTEPAELEATLPECIDYSWTDHIDEARAAIAAVLDSMAEPSESAYQAWWDRCHMGGDIIDDRKDGDDWPNGHIKRTWQAMLSAMRAEMLVATGPEEV